MLIGLVENDHDKIEKWVIFSQYVDGEAAFKSLFIKINIIESV